MMLSTRAHSYGALQSRKCNRIGTGGVEVVLLGLPVDTIPSYRYFLFMLQLYFTNEHATPKGNYSAYVSTSGLASGVATVIRMYAGA